MGALKYEIILATDAGSSTSLISELYVWRVDILEDEDGWYEYYAMRVPPNGVQMETVEEHTLTRTTAVHYQYITTPHVKFKHRYSDGAEICMARAILALQEAGMNV